MVFGFASPKPVNDDETGKALTKQDTATAVVPAIDSATAGFARPSRRVRKRTNPKEARRLQHSDSALIARQQADSLPSVAQDSLANAAMDSLQTPKPDSLRQKKKKGSGLDEIIDGKNSDSLFYDVRNKKVYIYNKGDVKYEDKGLQADFMQIDMETKEVHAYGKPDSVEGKLVNTHPVFTDGGSSYTMDTITYNFGSKKALIQGVATQEGDGWLVGGKIKKMEDNTVNIQSGKYTTCDHTDHPHFYLAMTKAKVIPGKKIITGPAYLVMEDVPIYFLGIPEGFFPINLGPK